MREEAHLSRGMILAVLKASLNLARGDQENIANYLDETVIYAKVGRRYPQTREMLRGHLFYLKDKGYVDFHEVKIGSQGRAFMWRITAGGIDLLDGTYNDPGVQIE